MGFIYEVPTGSIVHELFIVFNAIIFFRISVLFFELELCVVNFVIFSKNDFIFSGSGIKQKYSHS